MRLRDRLRRAAHALTAPPVAPAADEPPPPPPVPDDLVPLLRELGSALLSSGQSVMDTEHQLTAVADAYGADQVRVLVLPTGVVLQVETERGPVSDVTGPGSSGALRLHQVGAVDSLVSELVAGDVDLADARSRLRTALATPPRFGPLLVVLGHALLTFAFGLILYPVPEALWLYLAMGAAVGALRLVATRWQTLDAVLPVVAAFLVTWLCVDAVGPWLGGDPLRLLTPALVSFLPGAVLTVAAMELTSNQVVAGGSRMVFGIAQLLLLAFGVVAGVAVSGGFVVAASAPLLGWWSAWVGVLLVAVGHRYFSSPPAHSFWWIVLALYATFAAQQLGATFLPSELAGFVGGLVIAPVSLLIARARTGPPVLVTTLPAFWLLVPGALAFRGLSEIATGESFGAADLVSTALALFSIALGVLVGTSLTRDVRQVSSVVGRRVGLRTGRRAG
ncbi:threonine/serine exporter ThrE family protein [Cellulomonas sp. HZM]|uniref:threonine/serine ThrE exporter family protein n=1 Tax=Cellulomonas sp. HZM TaxID=1454010 RepID=UPI00068DB98D|nr:threonine/serine exporter family protein [Cellulomonas sp. HZM]